MKNELYNIVCESISLLEYSQLSDDEIQDAKKKLHVARKYALAGAALGGLPTALFHKNKELAKDANAHMEKSKKASNEITKLGEETKAERQKYQGDTETIKKALYYGALGGTAGGLAGKIHDYGVDNQLKGKATKQSLMKSALGGAAAGGIIGAGGGYLTKTGIRDKAWKGSGLGTIAGIGAGILYNKGVQKARDYIVNRNKKQQLQQYYK